MIWINFPEKVDPLQKNQDHLEGEEDPLTDPETSLLIHDTVPILMTDQADTRISYSVI